jgi:hypothetical protein
MSFLSKKARQYVPATLLVYSIVTHGQDSGNENPRIRRAFDIL